MTNSKKVELAKQVLQFSEGFRFIVHSITWDTEKSRILLYIIEKNERTKELFSYSLDDESLQLSTFSEAFAVYSDAFVYPSEEKKEFPQKIEMNEYEGCIIGFHMMKKALEKMVHICEDNKELEKELLHFNPSTLNDEDFDITYNPFKRIEIREWKRKFECFYESYLSDVEEVIGWEIYREIENKMKNYLNNDWEYLEVVTEDKMYLKYRKKSQ